MAKDGTMRGGARVGSGRKSKALTEKIDSGLAATVIDLPEPAEISGEDVPPVKDFLKAAQKSGIDLCVLRRAALTFARRMYSRQHSSG